MFLFDLYDAPDVEVSAQKVFRPFSAKPRLDRSEEAKPSSSFNGPL